MTWGDGTKHQNENLLDKRLFLVLSKKQVDKMQHMGYDCSTKENRMKPFVGYPGGKSRAAKQIIPQIQQKFDSSEGYCEVFAGGFSLGLAVLEDWKTDIWINEFDQDMYSLWHMVLNRPDELCSDIQKAKVTPESFYTLRERILKRKVFRVGEVRQRAIDKLIVHKISFSNMGEMSGSPVGGKHQTGDWKFDVRWKPDLICKRILKTSEFLKGARLTRKSFESIIPNIPASTLVYLDPPYVKAGAKCYKHAFTSEQHARLADMLSTVDFQWFMTYDNHPDILDLYSRANIGSFSFKYFMSSAYRTNERMKDGDELFISNF